MSWRGKRKDEDADSDGGGSAPAKKVAKKDASEDSDAFFVCEISKTRKVQVRSWQGKPVVDIREFYVKDGKELPGKKGISLTMDQWKILKKHVSEIDEAVAENS